MNQDEYDKIFEVSQAILQFASFARNNRNVSLPKNEKELTTLSDNLMELIRKHYKK